MPLPSHAFTVTGGCDCGAIRYRVAIPEASERPLHVFQSADGTEGHMPCIATCCCNSCRACSSSLTPTYLQAPGNIVTVSAVQMTEDTTAIAQSGCEQLLFGAAPVNPHSETPGTPGKLDDAQRPAYIPAEEVMHPGAAGAKGTWVRFYRTTMCSPIAARAFCGRCGTPMGYFFTLQKEWPFVTMREGWADFCDVFVGTLDRKHLEKEWMVPERAFWWSVGVPWVKKAVGEWVETKHPAMLTNQIMPDGA